jgi:3-oxoacyl-[acyl-carrier-protein] synthase II
MPSPSQVSNSRDVVITGLGVVSPIGIGTEAFTASLRAGRSGVRPISLFDASGFPVRIGAEVVDFDPKAYVRPRKSLKVMSREIQFGFAAADMAMTAAGLEQGQAEPDRFGVVFGAEMIYCELDELESVYRRSMAEGKFDFGRWGEAMMSEMFPLWMLRNLPNMVACQIAIVHDARGPNNTINLSDVSSLLAVIEAVRVIQRDAADIVIAGGVGARVDPTAMSYRGDGDLSHRNDEPAHACRPFDAQRDGLVNGEGAAAFILESRQHAQKRGAPILARVLSHASAHEPLAGNPAVKLETLIGSAIRQVLSESLSRAGLGPNNLGYVNAHGLSTVPEDRYEAQAIRAVLGDLPVTAPKSFFGHLGAGCGAMELAASIVGMNSGEAPVTLNYEQPDVECPVNVVHGAPLTSNNRAALKLSSSRLGHAAAMIIAAE